MTRTAAELSTPALVEVVATCPNCDERAALALHVSAVLEVGDDGSSLKLRAKSKKVDHLCGQVALPLQPVPGQASLEEAIGEGAPTISVDDPAILEEAKARPRSRKS